MSDDEITIVGRDAIYFGDQQPISSTGFTPIQPVALNPRAKLPVATNSASNKGVFVPQYRETANFIPKTTPTTPYVPKSSTTHTPHTPYIPHIPNVQQPQQQNNFVPETNFSTNFNNPQHQSSQYQQDHQQTSFIPEAQHQQHQNSPFVPNVSAQNTPFVPVMPMRQSASTYSSSSGQNAYQNNPINSNNMPENYANMFTPVQQVAGNVLYNMSTPMVASTQQVGWQWFNSTRTYFRVNNSYVARKLRILFIPFFHKDWRRSTDQSPDMKHLPPTEDLNSPDLYIPSMAFVSYVLLIGLFMGTKLVFTPDVIGETISRASFIIFFEVFLVKIAVWLLNLEIILSFLDIVAFSGYKFVGSVINVAIGLSLGNQAFYISYVINSLLFCIFLGKSLKAALHGQDSANDKTKNYLLFFWVLIQFILIYLLCNQGFT